MSQHKTLSEAILNTFAKSLLEQSVNKSFGEIKPLLQMLRQYAWKHPGVPEDYTEYMTSPKWHRVRDEFLSSMERCVSCGGSDDLHVHHLGYARFGCEGYGDCLVMCLRCHAYVHPFGLLPLAWATVSRSDEIAALKSILEDCEVDSLVSPSPVSEDDGE